MPAIDPERLLRQMQEIESLPNDSSSVARAVLEVLEEYSDPARPSTPSVPKPVIRSLRTTLHRREEVLAIAESLWRKGSPDARLLAAGLLEVVVEPKVASIAEKWAGGRVLIEIVRELGERGLTGWRRSDPPAFLSRIEKWLESGLRRTQVLALYALRARAFDEDFEDLPSVLELLHGRLSGARGEVKEALTYLVLALASVAPDETAIFLDDEDPSPLVKSLKGRLNAQRVGVV